MDEDKKPLIKDGRDFQEYPPMRVAKIYEPNPNQVYSRGVQGRTEDGPKYKVFLEIASPKINFSIEESVTINNMIDQVTDIEWTLEIEKHHLHIPTGRLMISGNLVGDIQYTTNSGKTYARKAYIRWKTTSTVIYTYPPIAGKENVKKEHTFKAGDDSLTIHREQHIYAEELTRCELISAHITTADEVRKTEYRTSIHMLIDVFIHVCLLQSQLTSNAYWMVKDDI